jgi:hypothetical protein
MSYKNFTTAIFYNSFDLERLKKDNLLEDSYQFFSNNINLDKVYLETYRSGKFLPKEDILSFKDFFTGKGIKVSGAITTTQKSSLWDFKSFCYSNPEHRKHMIEIIAYTASIFDEIIFDDFYFTNCKCDLCVKAKSKKSWKNFRTEQMAEMSREIVKTAKNINPNINMIIKYPNWYDHHQFTGYTPKDQKDIFDAFYTGTETRDSQNTQQVLQSYLGYFIMRYFESINPGKNLGGWFDPFDCSLDTYIEQLNMTLFAKAKEITLFCAGVLAYDYRANVPLAGYIFSELDKVLDFLGEPVGISCYKPYKSSGEDYLHGYLGMLGLPLAPSPEYPADSKLVLLTESAKNDFTIVSKIKATLAAGGSVIVTSGLLRALNIELSDIAEIYYTEQKVLVKNFAVDMKDCSIRDYCYACKEILLPHIDFKTNDAWQRAVALNDSNNHAVLLENKYSNGKLYVLTIPENQGDLYSYPDTVLNVIRETASNELPLHIEAPAKIGLFLYDNDTFIVESFRDVNTEIIINIHRENASLSQLASNKHNMGKQIEKMPAKGFTSFKVFLKPGAYKVFKIE